MARILFVTGTDTGVGKTLVAASLLFHLRRQGISALAMKPFCSGSRADVQLLQSIQRGAIADQEANPFYFREPLAPSIAARKAGKEITLRDTLDRIRSIASRCERLIVEGAGGLFAPLGAGFNAADLIAALECDVCVVAANKLGTINHTLLTVRALPSNDSLPVKVLLTQAKRRADPSTRTNAAVISELLGEIPVVRLPYLGPRAATIPSIRRNQLKTEAVWEAIQA